jgi:hypothetical protein
MTIRDKQNFRQCLPGSIKQISFFHKKCQLEPYLNWTFKQLNRISHNLKMTSEVIIRMVFFCHNKNSININAYLNLDFIFTLFYIYANIYGFVLVYMVLFLFDNVIYVFLLLWLCILIVCLCLTTLTEGFPCFFLSCKANARVKPSTTRHGQHYSSFLCRSMYFCVVLCIVCFVSFSVLFFVYVYWTTATGWLLNCS